MSSYSGGKPDESVRAYHDAVQSIDTATLTALAFNSENWDTNDLHDTVTNNSRLTAQVAGKYVITAHAQWEVNAAGVRQISFRVNGTTIIGTVRYDSVTVDATQTIQTVTSIWDLDVGDYVEALAWQTSGGALNVESGTNTPAFTMGLL